MFRLFRLRGVAIAFGAIMMVSHSFPVECHRAFGQEVSQDARAALKERNRLWDQAQKLHAAGKTAEAVAAGEAMLAIDRKLLPAGHALLADSLDLLAGTRGHALAPVDGIGFWSFTRGPSPIHA